MRNVFYAVWKIWSCRAGQLEILMSKEVGFSGAGAEASDSLLSPIPDE